VPTRSSDFLKMHQVAAMFDEVEHGDVIEAGANRIFSLLDTTICLYDRT
jgi:hypothetical protein